MIDLRIFRRLSSSRMPLAALALSFCLAGLDGSSVWADGGNGGSTFPDANGGTGGAGTGGNAGSAGTAGMNGGGGGGGGAAGGGAGGTGFATGAGGAGGTSGSPDGQAGASGSAGGNNGGGGGGGGFNGTESAIPLANTGFITGGNGGSGGNGAQSTGVSGGGGGGAGGYGAVVSSGGTSVNSGSITGGTGGKGGTGNLGFFIFGASGNGGDGGVGLQFTTPGATFMNIGATPGTAAVTGGNGGAGGDDFGIGPGSTGLGGQGIVGSDLTVVTNGLISGGLSGDGATRSNAITFTGGVNILEIQPGYLFTGNVVANSAADLLRLGGTGTATFNLDDLAPGQAFQNFGNLEKTGSGTWTLIGTSTYTGDTTVDAGRLAVNGTITSNVTVNSAGNLGGTGTITGDLLNDGSLTPGNSIGTLNMIGNFTQQSTGKLEIEIDAAGNTDQLNVTGNVNLDGTVVVKAAPGAYTAQTSYTFLTHTGSRTGTFSGISDDLAFFDAVLLYGAQDVSFFLQSTVVPVTYASLAQTYNEYEVGTVLDGGYPALHPITDQMQFMSTSQVLDSMNQLSGAGFGTTAQLQFQNSTNQLQLLTQHVAGLGNGGPGGGGAGGFASYDDVGADIIPVAFNREKCEFVFTCRTDGRPSSSTWMTSYGLGGSASGDGNASGLNYGQGGFLLGSDHWLNDEALAGVYGGYNYARFDTQAVTQRVQANSGQFGGYFRRNFNTRHLLFAGGFGFDGYDSSRGVNIGGFNQIASADYDGWQGIAYSEYGRSFATRFGRVQPYGALQYVYLRQNSFTETGAGPANLAVSGVDAESLRTIVGTRLDCEWVTARGRRLQPQLRVAWLHELLGTGTLVNNRFAAVAGSGFAAQGLDLGRDWALLGGGLGWHLNDRLSLAANYDAQVNANQTFHIGSANLQYVW